MLDVERWAELRREHFVRRVPIKGDRREHFEAETDIWEMFLRIAARRRSGSFSDFAISIIRVVLPATCSAEMIWRLTSTDDSF